LFYNPCLKCCAKITLTKEMACKLSIPNHRLTWPQSLYHILCYIHRQNSLRCGWLVFFWHCADGFDYIPSSIAQSVFHGFSLELGEVYIRLNHGIHVLGVYLQQTVHAPHIQEEVFFAADSPEARISSGGSFIF
jgi:hypothetical protein